MGVGVGVGVGVGEGVGVGGGGGIVFYVTLINFASIISVYGQIDLAL